MNTRAKQVATIAVGLVLAAVCGVLGLWQAQVFVDKGNRTVQARAEQPPVPLLDYVAADGKVGDIYGKQVTVVGEYVPGRELTIQDASGVRVLSGFRLADGRVVPVVRGHAGRGLGVPPLPPGQRTQTGLFLPGEGESDAAVAADQIGSVRMPLLAQRWPEHLVPGFVTLNDADAAAYGLTKAAVTLPEGEGSLQNGGYALQWWVFGAFGLGMSLVFARAQGAKERKASEDAARAELRPATGKDS